LPATILAALLAACGGTTSPAAATDGGADSAPSGAIGASCTPEIEQSPTFGGFRLNEVNLEENSPSCGGAVCLVNHFEGLTTCPYGQDASGHPPPGASACVTPVTGQPVAPDPAVGVPPQCTDRRPSSAVYCSCRCANADGRTDDGATYCTCPGSFTCTQLVTSIGTPGDTTSGAYCVEDGTNYDPRVSCPTLCDPSAQACP
jgi:hypothetical protein